MPTRELCVQGTQERLLPGIEPPHWTTEDYRSRYWAVYVSYPFSCFTYLRGRSWGGGGFAGSDLVCLVVCTMVC